MYSHFDTKSFQYKLKSIWYNLCETLKTVFDHNSKHLVHQKYSATCCINSLLWVWKYGQMLFSMFDIIT